MYLAASAGPASNPGRQEADRNSRNAALTLAFAQPGDTLLYLLLPLHHDSFGVSLAEAGLLLAANRLVRIAGYGWIARLFAEHGARAACLLAASGALLSTLGYALGSGVWVLLICRLLWGLSFAAMNVATQALATAEPTGAARRSGTMRSIDRGRAGQRTAGRGGGGQFAGPRAAFLCLAARHCSLSRSRRCCRAAARDGRNICRDRASACRPGSTPGLRPGDDLDGLFVLGLSVLGAASLPGYAALAAGAALALRYVAEILLAPLGGGLAERYGARRVLTCCRS